MLMTAYWQTLETEDAIGYANAARTLIEMLNTREELARCEGAIGLGRLCSELALQNHQTELERCAEALRGGAPSLVAMLFDGSPAEVCSATFAMEKLGACRMSTLPRHSDVLGRFFHLWRHGTEPTVQRLAARALASQPISSRDAATWQKGAANDILSVLEGYDKLDVRMEQPAILICAWYSRALKDDELVQRIQLLFANPQGTPSSGIDLTLRELLVQLGES